MCSRILHASCPTCFRALRVSCPAYSRASRASRVLCPTCSRTLRALVPFVPRVLRAFVPHVSRAMRALAPHLLHALRASVLYVPLASGFLCPKWPRASRFMSPFSLRTLLSLTLHTLCPNITFCALEFQCISLLIFCSFANCLFFSAHLLKLKQISFTSNTLKWRSVFISMIYLNYLKPNMKTYTYETANYFGTGKSKFRIAEITGNLSNSFGT